ncbi:MAG: hypothetical protein CMF56_11425 [Leifsonia sp.]|nr:hypothetical protein [Leifsonia sp.]|tara:strand:+ start:78868 stop:79101 length:234 start_codon:yes stop_codon:yes gene_type:complete
MTDPSARDKRRPFELIGLAAIVAVFVGAGVLLGTRDWLIAAQFAGGAFIVALVVLAMLLVATGPDDMAADDDRPSTH